MWYACEEPVFLVSGVEVLYITPSLSLSSFSKHLTMQILHFLTWVCDLLLKDQHLELRNSCLNNCPWQNGRQISPGKIYKWQSVSLRLSDHRRLCFDFLSLNGVLKLMTDNISAHRVLWCSPGCHQFGLEGQVPRRQTDNERDYRQTINI